MIAFEECWPLSATLGTASNFESQLRALVQVAQAIKIKEAAGLGTLGYALSEGNTSVLSGSTEDHHVKLVSRAIQKPKDFWEWVVGQSSNAQSLAVVEAAQKAYRRGGWPWDRAFMQAAAYLAVLNPMPAICIAPSVTEPTPLWVALDKHTSEGKTVFRNIAKQTGCSSRQVFWVSFYFESARTNTTADSYWWMRECQWRLRQVNLAYDEAEVLWAQLRPMVIQLLEASTDQLKLHLDSLAQFPLEPSNINPLNQGTEQSQRDSPRQLQLPLE
ncbi:MAG: hypothetical protein M3R24_15540 [Chloroflexota bacterium]|nr:hypothetical protein [Chloroflexota bacterium]